MVSSSPPHVLRHQEEPQPKFTALRAEAVAAASDSRLQPVCPVGLLGFRVFYWTQNHKLLEASVQVVRLVQFDL